MDNGSTAWRFFDGFNPYLTMKRMPSVMVPCLLDGGLCQYLSGWGGFYRWYKSLSGIFLVHENVVWFVFLLFWCFLVIWLASGVNGNC